MIDPSAVVLGDIELGDDVSIWPQCAIRADMHHIRIGQCTNVQDGAVLHITHASNYNPDGWPLTIGSHVTIGHGAILHGCTIGNHVLVGMRATVMDGAVVEDEVMLAAGCLVTPNKHCESGFVYAGSPGKKLRPLTDAERRFLHYSAENYVRLKDRYLQQSPSHAE
jgi:carbonic anhydrase/acetyltransferase-like protein (isoleucine patch superfamily)